MKECSRAAEIGAERSQDAFYIDCLAGLRPCKTQLIGKREAHSVPAKQFLPYLESSGQNV